MIPDIAFPVYLAKLCDGNDLIYTNRTDTNGINFWRYLDVIRTINSSGRFSVDGEFIRRALDSEGDGLPLPGGWARGNKSNTLMRYNIADSELSFTGNRDTFSDFYVHGDGTISILYYDDDTDTLSKFKVYWGKTTITDRNDIEREEMQFIRGSTREINLSGRRTNNFSIDGDYIYHLSRPNTAAPGETCTVEIYDINLSLIHI